MKNKAVKIGLSIVIIVLFIGVGIQPAIAITIDTSDSKRDCSICQPVGKPHLVLIKSLFNRLEILNNRLSVISNYNSEIAYRYRELSDRISTLAGLNLVLNPITSSWSFPILCTFLFPFWCLLLYLVEVGGTIIFLIASPIFYILNYLVNTFDCYWLTPK